MTMKAIPTMNRIRRTSPSSLLVLMTRSTDGEAGKKLFEMESSIGRSDQQLIGHCAYGLAFCVVTAA